MSSILINDNIDSNNNDLKSSGAHKNFMDGESYFPEDPLLKLKLILLSGFHGESGYYNPAKDSDILYNNQVLDVLKDFLIFPENGLKSRQKIFYETVNESLDYDFEKTIELALKGRTEFLMRKGPLELLAIAADHSKRVNFNENNPNKFRNIVKKTCVLPTDMNSILEAWKSLKGSKSKFPSFLKRSFSDKISNMTKYHAEKYRPIDMIRISHPSKPNESIRELMENGKVIVDDKDTKWETLRAQGKNWIETLDALEWRMPHMAALRNIRGFANNVRDETLIKKYCKMLEDGVIGGKQFPFRYITAYEQIKKASKPYSIKIKDNKNNYKKYFTKPLRKRDLKIIEECLENCIQISIKNHPKLEGDVIILSDNSGSAWGTCTSTFGTRKVAEIGNLSALITGLSCTGKAVIGLFGDKLLEYEVNKEISLLENYKNINDLSGIEGDCVGKSTENGIWLFFKRAMKNPDKYKFDHFFCYSDMQAGHGGLYGFDEEIKDKWLWNIIRDGSYYIHVPKLLENYRKNINKKLNVFMVQTAGYNDTILPQSTYRGAILSSWTGNEVVYADQIIKLWDQIENI